jgi:hypothetical protein
MHRIYRLVESIYISTALPMLLISVPKQILRYSQESRRGLNPFKWLQKAYTWQHKAFLSHFHASNRSELVLSMSQEIPLGDASDT